MARPSAQTGLDPRALFEHAEFYRKSAELLGAEIVKDMPRQTRTEFAFPQVFISTIAVLCSTCHTGGCYIIPEIPWNKRILPRRPRRPRINRAP